MLPAELLARHAARSTWRTSSASAQAREAVGKRGRDPRRPARAQAAARRPRPGRRPSCTPATRLDADDATRPRARASRLPVSWEGCPRPSARATRSTSPTAGSACASRGRRGRGALRGRGRRRGRLAPGHQPARAPTPGCRRPARDDLDWVDFAVEHGHRPARRLVRPQRRRPRAGQRAAARARTRDIPLIAKIEKPQAAENAEEIVEAAGSGIMVARGDLGIELPIAKVPVVQKRLLKLAGAHSKPSITATQMLASMVGDAAPDARRGDRRRQRDLRRHRRGDALRGDRRRRAPGRGGAVMDRIARETELDLPYERVAGPPRRRTRSDDDRQLGRPGRGRGDLPARPRRDRRSRPEAAGRPGWSPRSARACPCWRCRRGSRRCAG